MISSIDIRAVAGAGNVQEQVPLKDYTTFRAGGPADFFVTPETKEELIRVLKLFRQENVPVFLLGRGSNLLVSDEGFRGAVVSMKKNLNRITVNGSVITAEGGAMMPDIAKEALHAGLTGFEFASGIPGTIGGGLSMNAGAYGSELKNVVLEAELLFQDGTVRTLSNAELLLSYRHSVLKENGAVVLSVRIGLTEGDPEMIRARMDELNAKRREKQPLEYGSAGSTFKRPEGYFAGKLIEDAGLKGYMQGDTGVSEKHAGFVINKGNASAREIYEVIRHVREKVYENSGVLLEREVILLGAFPETE